MNNKFDDLAFKNEQYVLNLPYHLAQAEIDLPDELCQILIDFDFIEYKLSILRTQQLIEDYEIALNHKFSLNRSTQKSFLLIKSFFQLSATILDRDIKQLSTQLSGRLLSFRIDDIRSLLLQANQQKVFPWLRPLLCSLKKPEEVLLFNLTGHRHWVNDISIAPDGQKLVSCSQDCSLKLWDLKTGAQSDLDFLQNDCADTVAITPDSKYIVAGTHFGKLLIWDLKTKEIRATLQGHLESITSIAITSDGKYLVSASWDKTIKIWDFNQRIELRTLTGHTAPIASIAITPDGHKIVSASEDFTMKVWDFKHNKELHTFQGNAKYVDIAISSDNHQIVSVSSDNILRVWDLDNGSELYNIAEKAGSLESVTIVPNQGYAITGANPDVIAVWDLKHRELTSILQGHTSIVTSVAVTPDEKKLVSASYDTTIKVWNLEGKLAPPDDYKEWIEDVCITPNGKLAISTDGNKIEVWDLHDNTLYKTLVSHHYPISALQVTPDGKCIISGSREDYALKLWDLETGNEIRTFTRSLGEVVEISPDGKWVISTSDDKTLKAWELYGDAEIEMFSAGFFKAFAFTPDGKYIIAGLRDRSIKMWNWHTREEFHTLKGHTGVVNAIAVTPDGKYAISAGSHNVLKLWDLKLGKEVRTFKGHDYLVTDVVVTSDGKRIISTSEDRTLKVWDLESGEIIANFVDDGDLETCAVAPDGVNIVAGGKTGLLHFLRLESLDKFKKSVLQR